MSRSRNISQRGFTMIELLVAMSVFSFLLVIVVMGFMNIMRLHNQALASNAAQDNARTAMDELVRAVRDSTGVVSPSAGASGNVLCLASASGVPKYYYRSGTGILYRGDGCSSPANVQAVTSTAVQVSDFTATVTTSTAVTKPQVELSLTVASANGTTSGTGSAIQCGPSAQDRQFCAVVRLKSGAVPR